MTLGGWLGFAFIIFVQLFIYLYFLWRSDLGWQELKELPKHMISGVVFGLSFDHLIGKLSGIYSYDLGFGMFFLVLNGLLSFGLTIANVAIFRGLSLFKFLLGCGVVGFLYEVANLYADVWEWTFFVTPLYEYVLVILLANFGFGLVISACLQFFGNDKFLIWSSK